MNERRNFYRILHAQPDAPMAVIRSNYRTLMQKLRLHPDLGGTSWGASLLNIAYATLRDPLKRSTYDRELLRNYHISSISQGPHSVVPNSEPEDRTPSQTEKKNQRNYYRILQVQPGAPAAVITASYRALIKNLSRDNILLDEAYITLSDPAARYRYDKVLASILPQVPTEIISINDGAADQKVETRDPLFSNVKQYRAAMISYCAFCKTPHTQQPSVYQSENCIECASPLFAPAHEYFEQSSRAIDRFDMQGEFNFYLFWPSEPFSGSFQDLSPTGIRFLTEAPLDLHDILKIDAPAFQAIAEIRHCRCEGERTSIGTRFVTVSFGQDRGNFFTATA